MTTEQFRNLRKDKYVFHYFVDKDGFDHEKLESTGAVGRTFPGNASVNLRAWKVGDCNFEFAF